MIFNQEEISKFFKENTTNRSDLKMVRKQGQKLGFSFAHLLSDETLIKLSEDLALSKQYFNNFEEILEERGLISTIIQN